MYERSGSSSQKHLPELLPCHFHLNNIFLKKNNILDNSNLPQLIFGQKASLYTSILGCHKISKSLNFWILSCILLCMYLFHEWPPLLILQSDRPKNTKEKIESQISTIYGENCKENLFQNHLISILLSDTVLLIPIMSMFVENMSYAICNNMQ